MSKKSLYDKLIEYAANGRYGFHMPGHKRNSKLLNDVDPYDIDITEIEGFDNLHCAKSIIKESMDNAADFFGTDKTYFLVNGSTSGILSAINAVTDIGDSIIVGRNCHKAVYNAIEIRNLKAQYVYPEFIDNIGINGGYNPKDIEICFSQGEKIKAVVITSPTYEGIVSDIEEIAKITHKHGAILIVDSAHGPHFTLSNKLPVPAYRLGADVVIESTHKTLPALTQTALLHCMGNNVDTLKIEKSLAVYQSSSPSYLLMASIDKCIRDISTHGGCEMEKLLTKVAEFRENVNNLKHIYAPGLELKNMETVFDVDVTKLVIGIRSGDLTGKQLADRLRDKYNFEMEMESTNFVLAMTTIGDDLEKINELYLALKEIDGQLEDGNRNIYKVNLLDNRCIMTSYEAGILKKESVLLEEAMGRVSGEYISLYPPGIPLLVPGEVISTELINNIKNYKMLNMNIVGLDDKACERIKVIEDICH